MEDRRAVALSSLKNRQPRSEQQQQRSRRHTREVTPSRQGKGQVADTIAKFEKRPEPS